MRKSINVSSVALILLLAAGAAAEQKDCTGCQDHPLFTRMPGYWIYKIDQKQFDAYSFIVGDNKKETVEGQYWRYTYYPQATMTSRPSELQILRNFENAVQKLNGKALWSSKSKETFKIQKDGNEIWVEVWAEFTGKYGFIIVQKQAMAQDVVADAAALAGDINATGHAAVYGILFDTGKATIKPESAKAIGEIAKLLAGQPALKLYVVGHTDNIGGVESNIKLSQDRAEAVLQSLVRDHGVAAGRLRAFGCGLFAPVAANDTEEGRAKNRRVELVKQ